MATKPKRMKVSDQVRAAIESCGLTRYAIAQRTGIDQGTLSKFMAHESGLSCKALDKIGDLIGLEVTIPKRPRK